MFILISKLFSLLFCESFKKKLFQKRFRQEDLMKPAIRLFKTFKNLSGHFKNEDLNLNTLLLAKME